jgi:hypothetical protein
MSAYPLRSLDARVVWSSKDLAVLVGDLPAG